MAGISAADVKALREQTGQPMMDCKKALAASDGDFDGAVQWLRENGAKVATKRSDRSTDFGRFGLHFGSEVGAIVELKCESAPVTGNEEFIQLANDLAVQLATGPGAATPDELLAQPSPSKEGVTLGEQKEDLFNRIREVFNVTRIQRIDTACGGYNHNAANVVGVLVSMKGGNQETAKDIGMHIAAMNPAVLKVEQLAPEVVEKERKFLRDAAIKDGKPEQIVDKIVEGQLRKFYAESVLLEQPFVKDDKQSVGKYAKSQGMEVLDFVRWELGGAE